MGKIIKNGSIIRFNDHGGSFKILNYDEHDKNYELEVLEDYIFPNGDGRLCKKGTIVHGKEKGMMTLNTILKQL